MPTTNTFQRERERKRENEVENEILRNKTNINDFFCWISKLLSLLTILSSSSSCLKYVKTNNLKFHSYTSTTCACDGSDDLMLMLHIFIVSQTEFQIFIFGEEKKKLPRTNENKNKKQSWWSLMMKMEIIKLNVPIENSFSDKSENIPIGNWKKLWKPNKQM